MNIKSLFLTFVTN